MSFFLLILLKIVHNRSPQRLLLDLLCSERSYVQSLRRSLEVRGSCPAGLALRGSLEQLLNFHTHFLRDLQNCVSHPLTVSYCFLQHVSPSPVDPCLFLPSSCTLTHTISLCFIHSCYHLSIQCDIITHKPIHQQWICLISSTWCHIYLSIF